MRYPNTARLALLSVRRSRNRNRSKPSAGLYQAVLAGEEAAVQFYEEHVREVRRTVPPHQLLVFNVKQGWRPLCQFLEVPEPVTPFPRVNDTSSMLLVGRLVGGTTLTPLPLKPSFISRIMQVTSWTLIVGLPLLLLLAAGAWGWSVFYVSAAYLTFLLVLRIFSTQIFSRSLARVLEDKNKRV